MRVLIVDDSRLSRMMVRSILESAEPDWTLDDVDSGEKALEVFSEDENFDLVVMDFNMPGRNGLEIAEEIHKVKPAQKICLLTANVQDAIRQRAESLGVKFIAKPITEQTGVDIISYVN